MPPVVIFIAVCVSFGAGTVFAVIFKRNYLTAAALACTVAADIFLVLLNDYYEIALAFFSAAQILYAARILSGKRKTQNETGTRPRFENGQTVFYKYCIINCALRLAAVSAAITAVSFIAVLDILLILVCFYIVNFIVNIIFAFANFKKDAVFAIGLLLFLGCDICVGLMNLPNYISVTLPVNTLYTFMWIFYIPSQILMALSVINERRSAAARFPAVL